jgi:L-ascorbate metabolism protein UlaG (beta-lactamase superfamily)
MARLSETLFDEPLAERLSSGPGEGISLYWLGQAGFVIDADGRRVVIDPYLSDALAVKYAGTPYSHERMMPPPIGPDELGPVDLVLCTHHHTDHMDGETLSALAHRLPDLPFVVPAASASLARQRIGVDAQRLVPVDAGEHRRIAGISLDVMRAAHEGLERDEEGRHRFLGYGLAFGDVRIFHSGDTIPFDGQLEEVRHFNPSLALLPVNGRSQTLAEAGFAGNFTLDEALSLAERCGAESMIAHHYGMFAFNTVPAEAIDAAAERARVHVVRAREKLEFRLDDVRRPMARN